MSYRTERIKLAIQQVLTQPTPRDLQTSIGPSDMGNICNLCLAAKMAGEPPKRDFSLYPWLGTAMHKLIEWTTDIARFVRYPNVNDMAYTIFGPHSGARSEIKIFICHIPGYGDVWGNIDFLLPGEKCIVDWKSTSKKKIAMYKVKGVPTENQGQTIMYLHGALQDGYDVEAAVLVYIPRDAATLEDIWLYEVEYDAEEAQKLIDRATIIQQWIDAGKWREIPPHDDCYVHNPRGWWR